MLARLVRVAMIVLLLADWLSDVRPRQSPRSWVYDHKLQRYVQPPEE
jgi:hypothetical protein